MSTYVVGWKVREEEEELEHALAAVTRPPGVGKPDILFGTDHSGDAAVHIIYRVTTKIPLTKSRISVLGKFHEAIHNKIRTLSLDVIPYVRFGETNR